MFCLELIKFVTNYISGFVTSLISSHKLDLICSQIPVQQVLPYTTSERKKTVYKIRVGPVSVPVMALVDLS